MKIRRGFRKLRLGSALWQYRIGKHAGNVVIFGPSGIRYLTNQSILTGISWNDLERLEWKNAGSDHPGNIRPSHIRSFIEAIV